MDQKERMYFTDTQIIDLSDFNCKGRILDIGGGGEGIIGQLLKERVIAIDPIREELEEAADGPIKLVMDARDMQFLDFSFDTVTSFFTLMYMNKEDHAKVFQEVFRVLKEEGEFVIWDAQIPSYDNGIKDLYVIPLFVELNGKKIETAYGVLWKKTKQDVSYYTQLGKNSGFELISVEQIGETFMLRFKKFNS